MRTGLIGVLRLAAFGLTLVLSGWQTGAATFDIADGDVPALIDAINTANGNGEANTINLALDGIYTLTAVDNVNHGGNGLPPISSELTINGNGALIQRSDAGGIPEFRLFYVPAGGDLTLNDVILANGKSTDGEDGDDVDIAGHPGEHGGGILNYDTVVLNDSIVQDCRAGTGGDEGHDGADGGAGGCGGGISNFGELEILDSVIRNCRAGDGGEGTEQGIGGHGGGIHNAGTLTLMGSEILSNETGHPGGGDHDYPGGTGGGIYHKSGSEITIDTCTIADNVACEQGGGVLIHEGTLLISDSTIRGNSSGAISGGGLQFSLLASAECSIRRCTINNNSCTGSGGGISVRCPSLLVSNSTIHGNLATLHGGGIYKYGNGSVTVVSSTISGNRADEDENGAGDAGGIHGQAKLKNSIIAGNVDLGGEQIPDANTIDSYGFNLIGDTSGCAIDILENPGTDILDQDPQLGPLQDNGGLTFTQALPVGSPAVEQAACTDLDGNAIDLDQRSVARPQGDACDMGAFELERTDVAPPPSSGCGTNSSPIPNAGDDQTVSVGETVMLDGSASYDPDEGPSPHSTPRRISPQYAIQLREDLTFEWAVAILYYAAGVPVLAIPDGSNTQASLQGANSEIASFVPDVPGIYQFDLFITDDHGDTVSDRVAITCLPRAEDHDSFDDEPEFERFLIYPNPFAGVIYFGFSGRGEAERIEVNVFDLSGHLVWHGVVANATEIAWDGRNLDGQFIAAGPYLFQMALVINGQVLTSSGIVFHRY